MKKTNLQLALAVLTLLALLFFNIVPLADINLFAAADTSPPIFESISVDKKVVGPGDEITVTVEASDDISGVSDIKLRYLLPSGYSIEHIQLEAGTDGKYHGFYTIGEYDEIGIWQVEHIDLSDQAGNNSLIFNSQIYAEDDWINSQDLSAANFTVDITAPTIEPDPTSPSENSTAKVEMVSPEGKIYLPESEDENVAQVSVDLEAQEIKIPESIRDKVEKNLTGKGYRLLNAFDLEIYKKVTTQGGATTEHLIENKDILEKISIRILLSEEQAGKDNLAVAYIDDQGNISIIEGIIERPDTVKYFTFETDLFSIYALVEKISESVPKTEDSTVPLAEDASTPESELISLPKTGERAASTFLGLGLLLITAALFCLVQQRNKRAVKHRK